MNSFEQQARLIIALVGRPYLIHNISSPTECPVASYVQITMHAVMHFLTIIIETLFIAPQLSTRYYYTNCFYWQTSNNCVTCSLQTNFQSLKNIERIKDFRRALIIYLQPTHSNWNGPPRSLKSSAMNLIEKREIKISYSNRAGSLDKGKKILPVYKIEKQLWAEEQQDQFQQLLVTPTPAYNIRYERLYIWTQTYDL